MYDYLVVGAGLFGSVFARLVTDAGKRCLVIDKRNHIAGNCYTENIEGIDVHKYGPHIFHTSNEEIWNFVNRFTQFNNYTHRVKGFNGNRHYTLPFNLKTFSEIDNIQSPEHLKEVMSSRVPDDTNLETWAISQVGEKVYEILIKGYTTKQWGKDPKELPASIIKRIPIRLTFDDNYFNDVYQGIPINGYTSMIDNLLEGIPVMLSHSFTHDMAGSIAKKTVFTGPIDEFFDCEFGKLEYRSLDFVEEKYDIEFFQGCAQVNHSNVYDPHTRIVEHKHFTPERLKDLKTHTIITMEFPTKLGDPYYPINDSKNNSLYKKYKEKAAEQRPDVIFGGRLGNYQYYDMHQVIGSAMKAYKDEVRQWTKSTN